MRATTPLTLLAATLALVLASPTHAATFLVNTARDTADVALDGVCADFRGKCSLRAAIMEANRAPDYDTINFRHFTWIRLRDFLPAIDAPVQINGHTARGAPSLTGDEPAAPVVTIDGERTARDPADPYFGPGATGIGLHLTQGASGSRIHGLSIINFENYEILSEGASNAIFSGLWVGVDILGRASDRPTIRSETAKFDGVRNQFGEFSSSFGPEGRGNVFAQGVVINGNENYFARNRVGADAAGHERLGERGYLDIRGDDNVIGAPTASESTRRNVISRLNLMGDGNIVVGSFVGRTRDLDGFVSLVPRVIGSTLTLDGTGNVVGDGSNLGRNYIGGRVEITGDGATISRNSVTGNVELSSSGTNYISGNLFDANGRGIALLVVTEVGVTDAVENIVINANAGMAVYGYLGLIRLKSNLIGTTTRTASADRGNVTGIYLGGGNVEVYGNVIAHNRTGLLLDLGGTYGEENVISDNRFAGNCGLGIDVKGVTGRDVNDPGDLGTPEMSDAQNSPEVLTALYQPGPEPSLLVKYRVDNQVASEYPMTIEFYLSDEKKVNQGARVLAVTEYDPNRLGDIVSLTIPLPPEVEGGALVAMVATASGFTGLPSEFSYPVLFGRTDIVLDHSIDECELD